MIATIPIFRGEPNVSLTTVWTIPNGHRVVAKTLVLSNFSGAAKTFSLKVIPQGASDSAEWYVLENYSVPSGNPSILELQLAIEGGDRIQIAGQAGVRCYLSGIETDI